MYKCNGGCLEKKCDLPISWLAGMLSSMEQLLAESGCGFICLTLIGSNPKFLVLPGNATDCD